jgi:hypothetical protein
MRLEFLRVLCVFVVRSRSFARHPPPPAKDNWRRGSNSSSKTQVLTIRKRHLAERGEEGLLPFSALRAMKLGRNFSVIVGKWAQRAISRNGALWQKARLSSVFRPDPPQRAISRNGNLWLGARGKRGFLRLRPSCGALWSIKRLRLADPSIHRAAIRLRSCSMVRHWDSASAGWPVFW